MTKFLKRPEFLLDALVIALAVPTIAIAATMSSGDYKAAKERASADYKAAVAHCGTMSGNQKDVCKAEAKAAEKKAKAEAEASFKNTDKARRDARIETAEADYDVAKAKCDAMKGNERDVCVKDAKAAEVKAKADAKATEKVAAVRQEAAEDKRDAEYKAARERCDSMSGSAKDACVASVKAKYGK